MNIVRKLVFTLICTPFISYASAFWINVPTFLFKEWDEKILTLSRDEIATTIAEMKSKNLRNELRELKGLIEERISTLKRNKRCDIESLNIALQSMAIGFGCLTLSSIIYVKWYITAQSEKDSLQALLKQQNISVKKTTDYGSNQIITRKSALVPTHLIKQDPSKSTHLLQDFSALPSPIKEQVERYFSARDTFDLTWWGQLFLLVATAINWHQSINPLRRSFTPQEQCTKWCSIIDQIDNALCMEPQ